jgi:hypothetical protein
VLNSELSTPSSLSTPNSVVAKDLQRQNEFGDDQEEVAKENEAEDVQETEMGGDPEKVTNSNDNEDDRSTVGSEETARTGTKGPKGKVVDNSQEDTDFDDNQSQLPWALKSIADGGIFQIKTSHYSSIYL